MVPVLPVTAGGFAFAINKWFVLNLQRSLRFPVLVTLLQDLVSLDLPAMAGNVETIAHKAAKEAHQESALATLQATWDRIEFCTTFSADTDAPLLKMREEDVEVMLFEACCV